MLVLLGEVGGIEEYTVCDLLKDKRITKPIIAWCIGTCSDVFSTDVQVRSYVQTINIIIDNLQNKIIIDVILNDAHAITNSSLVTPVLVHQVLEKRLVRRMQPSKMREQWFLKILMSWETQLKAYIR